MIFMRGKNLLSVNFSRHAPQALKNDIIHVTFFGSWFCCMTHRDEEVGGSGDRVTPFWVVAICTHWDEGCAALKSSY